MGINDPTLVDILAWQFHVDFYDATRDLEFRKRLVQMSIQWHITKGTRALVEEVLNTYWPGGATLSEWFEYYQPLPPNYPTEPGWHDRYRFRVYIDEQIIDPEDEAAVLALIDRYKPISRWCEGIFRPTASDLNIGWCGACLRFIIRESAAPDYP
jgi:P2-related tail formation protein